MSAVRRSTPADPPEKLLVVVPTYDEADTVRPLSERLLAAVPDAEILFVDDSSPDGTAGQVAELGRRDPRIRLLSRPGKLGLGTAYLAGFAAGLAGGYDRIVTMDADLSHDPAHLPELLAAEGEADLVIGSRYVAGGGIRNWGFHRRLLSRWANRLARAVLGLPVRDVTSGFRVYRASALERLPLETVRSSGYAFLEEITFLAHRAGMRIAEVPIVFWDREGGRSKISAIEILWAGWRLLRLALGRPLARRDRAPARSAPELSDRRLLAGTDPHEP